MELRLESSNSSPADGSALVVFVLQKKAKGTKEAEASLKGASKSVLERLQNALSDKSLSAKASDIAVFREVHVDGYRHLVTVGMGLEENLTIESVRQGVATALPALKALKVRQASIALDTLQFGKKDEASVVQAAAEGLLLADYSFEELKSGKNKEKGLDVVRLETKSSSDRDSKKAFAEALILAESVNFSRRLGDMPGNLMTPSILAQHAVQAAKGTSIKVTVWDKARIKKERMGGLLGVSRGSSEEPRFIIMEYKGAASSQKPLILVGKGLTFDCGGISIKPSAGMEEMKYDMCGGANVIGATLAIARLKLKVNIMTLVPSTENLAGPSATKPGDVHTARNGKTFEVNNTDAEGRLILADALSYASEQKPQAIIDAATLTGAMVVALGNVHTGYFTRNKDLKTQIENAAEVSGEWVWNMPLTDHHVKDMKGTFADLSNISASKGAGSSTAAAFLEQFVDSEIPWAHFDIAGTGWSVGSRLNYCPKKGASGVMIRTFVELARSFSKS